ncbi:MAG: hypothetical protein ACLTZY_11010 [Alistipes indistinctus]
MKRLTGLPDDVARLSALITLNENLLEGTIAPQRFLRAMIAYLPQNATNNYHTSAHPHPGLFRPYTTTKRPLPNWKVLYGRSRKTIPTASGASWQPRLGAVSPAARRR